MSKTNYMGIRRLKAIFVHFISNDEELYEAFKKDRREHGDSWIFTYRRSQGCEWLEVDFGSDYIFKYFVHGAESVRKTVSLTIYRYCELASDYAEYEYFVTYYDSNYDPLPSDRVWSGSKHRYLSDTDSGRFDLPWECHVCSGISKSGGAR